MKTVFLYLFYSLYFSAIASAQNISENGTACFSHFITGIINPEDLNTVPNQNWVIVCSMATTTNSGKIYAVNKENETQLLLFDSRNFGDLFENTHLKTFAPHGIYLYNHEEDYILYVISHGSSETIELFNLDFTGEKPQANWIRSLDLPASVWANGLVVDRDKNIYVSSMYDPNDASFLEKFETQGATGQIWKWSMRDKWSPFSKAFFSAANGIAISSDQKSLYLSEWANQKVHQLSVANGTITKSIAVDFLPDNIRWSTAGNLLIAGQRGQPKQVFLSKGISETNRYFSVVSIDPSLTRLTTIIHGGDLHFANATVAVDLGHCYWLGCVENNKIAVYLKN